MKDLIPDFATTIDDLRKRASVKDGTFAKKFEKIKLDGVETEFTTQLGSVSAEVTKVLDELKVEVKTASDELGTLARKDKDGNWVAKSASTKGEAISLAKKRVADAKEDVSRFLRGDERNGVTVPEKLSEAFKTMEGTVNRARGVLDNVFGRIRTDGFDRAIKHNLGEMKFWEEGKHAVGFARSAVAAGGAAAMVHGTFVSKDAMGEERGGMSRLLEVLVGGAAIGGAVAFGKAR